MKRLSARDNPDEFARVYNRVASFMFHAPRYSIQGIARLAADSGVSRTAVSRLISGHRRPAYLVVLRVVASLERELGVTIDPREVVRDDPHYPTPYPCAVIGCKGCLPAWMFDDDDRVLPEYAAVKPGQWSAPDPIHFYNP